MRRWISFSVEGACVPFTGIIESREGWENFRRAVGDEALKTAVRVPGGGAHFRIGSKLPGGLTLEQWGETQGQALFMPIPGQKPPPPPNPPTRDTAVVPPPFPASAERGVRIRGFESMEPELQLVLADMIRVLLAKIEDGSFDPWAKKTETVTMPADDEIVMACRLEER